MHDGKIWIADWNDNRHEMTPDELLERIRTDSKSNWNWIAPATEIVKTISDPEFPEPIANELKGLILKCFADILLSNLSGTEKSTDQIAVAYCYYSLHGKAEKSIKRLYRKNLISATVAHVSAVSSMIHGKAYRAFCKKWEKDAFKNFTRRFGIDFMRFGPRIKADFEASLKRAELAGEFENDKIEHEERLKEFAKTIRDAL